MVKTTVQEKFEKFNSTVTQHEDRENDRRNAFLCGMSVGLNRQLDDEDRKLLRNELKIEMNKLVEGQ